MEGNRAYSLYRHVSPSGKVYVGITSMTPQKRWGSNGVLYCKHENYPFARAIKKYGWSSFKHDILFTSISKEKAMTFERHLISFYRMLGLSYNITDGGEAGFGNRSHLGQKASLESRRKMSASRSHVVYQYSKDGAFIREWNSQKEAAEQLGIRRTSISAANCGRIPSAGGYYWSPNSPGTWSMPIKRHTESGRKKCVYRYDLNGNLINEWDSLTTMNKNLGFSIAAVALACTYGGKIHNSLWSYNYPIELKKIEAQKQIAGNRNTGTKK